MWYQVSEESSSVSELGNEELWQCGAHPTLIRSSLWVSVPVLVPWMLPSHSPGGSGSASLPWWSSSDGVQHQWLQKELQVFPQCWISFDPVQGVLYIPAWQD